MNPFQQLISGARSAVVPGIYRTPLPQPRQVGPPVVYQPPPPLPTPGIRVGGGPNALSQDDIARQIAAQLANPGGPILRHPGNIPSLPQVMPGLGQPGQMGHVQPAPDDEGYPQGIVYGYANGQTFYDTPQGRIAYAMAQAQSRPRTNTNTIVRELARRLGQSRRRSGRSQRAGI